MRRFGNPEDRHGVSVRLGTGQRRKPLRRFVKLVVPSLDPDLAAVAHGPFEPLRRRTFQAEDAKCFQRPVDVFGYILVAGDAPQLLPDYG